MSFAIFLADIVAISHAAFIAFVVFGLLLILAGAAAGWSWVRNIWFRSLHLLAISFVCLESFIHMTCPLTLLESHLRRSGGGSGYQEGFIGYWVDRLIFHHFPQQVFTIIYIAFGLLVLAAWIFVPPCFKRRVG